MRTIMESKGYRTMTHDGGPGAAARDEKELSGVENGKGRVYDFYIWMPSMEDMRAAGVDVGSPPGQKSGADSDEDEKWDGKPQIEYHVSDDEDD
jgi:hypothetical protein